MASMRVQTASVAKVSIRMLVRVEKKGNGALLFNLGQKVKDFGGKRKRTGRRTAG
jgi:hypothetical protein